MSKTVKPSRRAAKPDDPVARLSFVASRDGKTLPKPTKGQAPRCFWHVKATGDYGADCIAGNAFALEYLAHEEADRDKVGLLQLIVPDMPRKLTGIEIAFLAMVSLAVSAGAGRAREISAYWERCRKGAGQHRAETSGVKGKRS